MLSAETDLSADSHNGMIGRKTGVKFANSHWSVQITLFCLRPLCQICFVAMDKLHVSAKKGLF